jgi:hypothetical protein
MANPEGVVQDRSGFLRRRTRRFVRRPRFVRRLHRTMSRGSRLIPAGHGINVTARVRHPCRPWSHLCHRGRRSPELCRADFVAGWHEREASTDVRSRPACPSDPIGWPRNRLRRAAVMAGPGPRAQQGWKRASCARSHDSIGAAYAFRAQVVASAIDLPQCLFDRRGAINFNGHLSISMPGDWT